ncbi:MAG: DUF1638 domain-containing protein [Planctomycetes bacterium]|nr:DUF1638 domain-containing protein [Planctomycetota bacterium]
MADTNNPRLKLKFIGCEIIYREACLLASRSPHIIDLEFLRKGLHDLERADMISHIQSAVDSASRQDRHQAIILGFARCNDGLVGLTARRIPLVIPRAHDCITFFMGSRQAYRKCFDECPGTYYLSTGWLERNTTRDGQLEKPAYGKQGVMAKLGLADSYEQMVEKYGKEDADYIMQTIGDWTKNYSRMMYLKMGVCDETAFIDQAGKMAADRGWQFQLKDGSWSLLEKLFFGQWDDDFLTIPPGKSIIARNDDLILDVS